MHDSAQVMEGGLAIEIKGSLRLRFRYEVVDDLDEDVGNVALMQGICKSARASLQVMEPTRFARTSA